MSKERAILRRLASSDNRGDIFIISNELLKEIEVALAEPEQEPVAWMYDHHIEVGHDKYTEFNVVETCARNLEFESCINVRPLYLTPPKREQKPLTPQQISEGNQSMLNVTRDAFVNGVKYAEQQHGIGE